MSAASSHKALNIDIKHHNHTFSLSLSPYPLTLRTTFGTSHSATNERLNALIAINVGAKTGHGECAMPPKKPGIYLADYHDCYNFFEQFCEASKDLGAHVNCLPFTDVPAQFFTKLRDADDSVEEVNIVRALFGVMDSLEKEKEWRVCRNAIEMALLDLWGQILSKPTAELLLGSANWNLKRPSYYTVAMNSDLNEMKASVYFGLQHTPYLKLKMDKNIEFWSGWLPQLFSICEEQTKEKPESAELRGKNLNFVWSIDANADWSPEVARQMLSLLTPYKEVISMIEQPFQAHLNVAEKDAWNKIKLLYGAAGFVIYADESVSTASDIEQLVDVCHGINIKLDKTGGVREALRTWERAVEHSLGVWIGIMVSSRLSTSMASCVLPLSTLGGDLDGQLLVDVKSDAFTGGLNWDVTTGLCSPPTATGLGLVKK